MKKDQREVITIAKVKSDLAHDCGAETIACVFMGLSVLLWSVAAVLFLKFVFAEMVGWDIIPVAFAAVFSLVALLCIAVFILAVRRIVIEKRIIKN